MSKYPNLFRPLKIGKTTFRNRIFATPTSLTWADCDGAPNDNTIFYYEDKARGGAASVTLSETSINRTHASRGVGHFILPDKRLGSPLTQLSKIVEAIRRHGSIPSIQLHHAGDVTFPSFTGGHPPIGPNSYTRKDGIEVKGMDEDLMLSVAEEFATATLAAKNIGFGMVQIHGAHGWLLAQFMSAATNWRKDKYGGGIENRARFPLMVIKAIREKVGPEFILEYRLSGDEHLENGITKEEAAVFGSIIEDYVDIIHVSAGSYYSARQYTFPGTYQPHGINIDLAAEMKKRVNIPVATVGAHMDPKEMERILGEGKADIIAIGRAIIADPELPNKIQMGQEKKVIPCIRCNNCLGRKYERLNNCDVNPLSGNELYNLRTPPVTATRKVLVIGGGPGGMQAAITAEERGHKVTLVEKTGELGGNLRVSDFDEHKRDLRAFKNYLIRQLKDSTVEVRINTTATKELLQHENPDAIIIATGASPIDPDFPGMENSPSFNAPDAYRNVDKIGEKVAVIGGGLIGCETAIFLAKRGKKVTVIEMQDKFASDANIIHLDSLMEVFNQLVTPKLNSSCCQITTDGVIVKTEKQEEELIEADTVVYAIGMKPNDEELDYFYQTETPCMIRPIGDCVSVSRVKDAIHNGYHAAMDIR